MKLLSILLLISGAFVSIFGILPFIFAYPYSNGPNSGPSNWWELILILSYDGKGWMLLFGIVLLLFSIPLLIKQIKASFI